MCQIDEQPVHSDEIFCFKVYEIRPDGEKSPYQRRSRPNVGIPVESDNRRYEHDKPSASGELPFHAFQTKEDVERFLTYNRTMKFSSYTSDMNIYSCKLSGHLTRGTWSVCSTVHTCMGKTLTVHKRVGHWNHITKELKWIDYPSTIQVVPDLVESEQVLSGVDR